WCDLPRSGHDPHRSAAARARYRRQRLVFSGHRRGAVLAAVEPPDSGGNDLRGRAAAGACARRAVLMREALLVVQPGSTDRLECDTEAALWGGWIEGV